MTNNSNNLQSDQLAPHSVEAEEAVLGAVLINPEALFEVIAFLRAEDFFIVRHTWIWEAMLSLHERRDPIDYLTVVSELEQMGRLSEIGGAAYILSLVNKTPSALNAEGYGRIVERMALRRRLIEAAGQIARVAHSEETDIDEVVNRAEQAVFEVTQRQQIKAQVSLKEAISAELDRSLYIIGNPGAGFGLPTHLKDLDDATGGMGPGELIIVACRPGMGKSSLLTGIAIDNAAAGIPVAIFSLEMDEGQIARRFMSRTTEIDGMKIKQAKFSESEWKDYIEATTLLENLPLYIDSTPGINPAYLRQAVRRNVLEHGVQLIVLDYIQLMNDGRKRQGENRTQEISYISRTIKEIAREYHVPVVAASQLSRKVEARQNKRPLLSDLRESGSLEQDADWVWMLYRDEYYNPDTDQKRVTELNIAKAREGKTGTVRLIFIAEQTTFKDAVTTIIELPN